MSSTLALDKVNELGFYEMRFESVGGLGANLAGQVLAEAIVKGQGFNGAHFSSYGSEKKGSPVKSNLRICAPDQEVRSSSPVDRPHLLAVFHRCLLKVDGITAGLYPDSTLVVNSPDPIDEVRNAAKLASGTLVIVDALAIAVETNSRINTAIMGAIVRAAGFIDPQAVEDTIAKSFKDKYPQLVEANLKAYRRGYEEIEIKVFPSDGKFEAEPYRPFVPDLGYANAPLGGAIVNPGNTISKDFGASRQGIYPLFSREKCTDCGLCSMTCPDFCLQWEQGADKKGRPAMVLKGVNLQYCKGCLKCVDICPVDALTMWCERPEFAFTANAQLWGPPDALASMGRKDEPAKWDTNEGSYWRRVS